MDDRATTERVACDCKVGRVAAEYGLDAVHDDIGGRWTEKDASVRDLTDRFNRQVLRAALERSSRSPLDGEVTNLYRLLSGGEGVDAASRTRARERLRQDGVPVDEVEAAFVSHQTLYRHLVDCLDRSKDPAHADAESLLSTWRDRIGALETRTARVTERGLEQLRAGDAITVGSADVIVEVNVICEECGEFFAVEELLDRRSCGCGGDPGEASE